MEIQGTAVAMDNIPKSIMYAKMLHVISTYHHKCMENVGKYSSPMEHMGTGSSHII